MTDDSDSPVTVACMECGHEEASHAIWDPGFVGCCACKSCPQWTPPGTVMDEDRRQAIEREWEVRTEHGWSPSSAKG